MINFIHEDNTTVRQKRGVVFQSQIEVKSIPHKSELTARQKHMMWYTKNEYAIIKDSRKRDIARLDKISSIFKQSTGNSGDKDSHYEDDGFCSYGLYCSDETLQRMTRVYQAQDALFQEQDLQCKEDISDPELLADIYFEGTRLSQREALARATLLFQQLTTPPSREERVRGRQLSKRATLVRTKAEKRLTISTKPAPIRATTTTTTTTCSTGTSRTKKRSSFERKEAMTKAQKSISSMKQITEVKKSLEIESPSLSLVKDRQQRNNCKKMVVSRAA